MKNSPVITIDGPSGAGKGTVSLMIAKQLGWHFLDSGAIYRLLALAALKRQIDPENITELAELGANLNIEFRLDNHNNTLIYLDNADVTQTIREDDVAQMASKTSCHQPVRDALLKRQQDFLQPPGLVADGRDMGTVVFPEANLKIFLTASQQERARRRHAQLQGQGINVSLADVLQELAKRDARDQSRKACPLLPAKDAVQIDTTELSIEDVVSEIMRLYQAR